MLSHDDYLLCDQVSEDLKHIRESWIGELSEHVIRRESPIIRRLLVDNDYFKAWRKLGLPKQPIVMGYDLDEILGDTPKKYIGYAFPTPNERTSPTGGSEQSAVMKAPENREKGDLLIVASSYVERFGAVFLVVPEEEWKTKDKEEVAQELISGLSQALEKPMWITEFLDSSGAYVNGEKITRRAIIDFVANSMGGAHFDQTTKRTKKASRLLLKPLHVRWRGINDVHAPWIELCSICQSLAWSPDAMRFAAEFQSISPPAPFPGKSDP